MESQYLQSMIRQVQEPHDEDGLAEIVQGGLLRGGILQAAPVDDGD